MYEIEDEGHDAKTARQLLEEGQDAIPGEFLAQDIDAFKREGRQ
jgi:hypothetical protein